MRKDLLLKNLAVQIAALFCYCSSAYAQVSTDPVGFVNSTIAASISTGIARITPFSPVMLEAPSVAGATAGPITSVTSNTITVTSAGWTANTLSAGQSYLHVTSGNQSGLVLRIISNTTDTATVETLGLDIVAFGVASGDTFRLVVGETLLSMFGTGSATPTGNVVLGGTTAQFNSRSVTSQHGVIPTLADKLVTTDASGSFRSFYFNGTNWIRSGSSSLQDTSVVLAASAGYTIRLGSGAPQSLTVPLPYSL
jgi:hypothetical protein